MNQFSGGGYLAGHSYYFDQELLRQQEHQRLYYGQPHHLLLNKQDEYDSKGEGTVPVSSCRGGVGSGGTETTNCDFSEMRSFNSLHVKSEYGCDPHQQFRQQQHQQQDSSGPINSTSAAIVDDVLEEL